MRNILKSRLLLCAIAALPLTSCGGSDVIDPPGPPAPVIGLAQSSASFSFTTGGANPAPVTIALTSSGSNTAAITGLVIGNIGYGAGGSGWLTASLSGPETPATLTLAASPSGLAAGSYSANVPISSSMAGVASQNVQVTFTVGAPTGERIYIAGNIAQCGTTGDQATAALLDNLPGTIFTAGDNAFPQGSATDYATCYDPSWGRFKSRTWATMGNHEYDQGNANDAFAYFGSRAGPAGLGYYSVDVGAWHIIVLNDNGGLANYGAGSAQMAWLRQDLASSTQRCTMAIWHQPLFFSSVSGATQGSEREVLWDTLYAHGVDVVVNGHMHFYERLAPMDPSGARDDAAGIRQFNSGVGGASSVMPTTMHPLSQRVGTDFGVLELTLRSTSYDWRFIPVAGKTFTDTGTGSCH
jgi:hypothetical protein